jgi:signal peptide peptidase SppA
VDDFPLLDEVEDAEERALYAEAMAAVDAGEEDDSASTDSTDGKKNSMFEKLPKLGGGVGGKLAKLAQKRSDAEAKYVTAVARALPAHKRERLLKLLADPRMSPGWEGDRDPLAVPATRMDRRDKPHVFVLQFFGDVRASQASNLREEVTAVLRSAKKTRGDEVVLVLNTGGGTVTGYGLAAAQLTRLKDAGIKLTICVEQVAASGGYMMACTADRLVASPFAVLGSIGVISEIPNVYERLKKEGVEFQTVTAGKFKRTLTPTKKIEKADVEKSKADIEDVLTLFKTFVKTQRPKLVIDDVATGETWFGADALKRDLCDELKTTDDVLLELLATGSEIFSVKYRPPQSGPAALLAGAGDDARSSIGGGNGWGALRAAALGVAGFAQAAGGLGSNFGGAYGSSGEALAVDGADVAGKVMARGASGRYLGEEDYVGGGIFSAVDDDEDVYF